MTARHLNHRKSVLWVAALVHRLSGLALAIFLPLHFLTLGLASTAERLDGFLRWSDQPIVKLARKRPRFPGSAAYVPGLRLLVIGNPIGATGRSSLQRSQPPCPP